MQAVDKEESIVLSTVLLIITLTCLGLSFWSMASGYESLFNSYIGSSAFAFMLVLMMFAINYKLRRGLMNGITGTKIAVILLLYAFVVAASFSGMFNKFYGSFMKTELIKEELDDKNDKLTDIGTRATDLLSNAKSEKLRNNVTQLTNQFKEQVISPAEPGLGAKANEILNQIEMLIGAKITRIPPVNKTPDTLKEYGIEQENRILLMLDHTAEMMKLNGADMRKLLEELPNKIDPLKRRLQKAKDDIGEAVNDSTKEQAILAIQSAVTEYKAIGNRTKSLDSSFTYENNISVENDRIGKISHSYSSAFNNKHIGHPAVWLAVGLALLIDLAVPLFVFLLTPKGNNAIRRVKNDGIRQL